MLQAYWRNARRVVIFIDCTLRAGSASKEQSNLARRGKCTRGELHRVFVMQSGEHFLSIGNWKVVLRHPGSLDSSFMSSAGMASGTGSHTRRRTVDGARCPL